MALSPRKPRTLVVGLLMLCILLAGNLPQIANGGVSPTSIQVTQATPNLTWVSRASMATAREGLGVALTSDGNIYAVGGGAGSQVFSTVEAYDPSADNWTLRTSMPTARCCLSLATGTNGKMYAIGGFSTVDYHDPNGKLSTVEEYDLAQDSWTPRAPMLTARDLAGVATYTNGRIYVIGGWDGNQALATVESYDPLTNSWQSHKSMPTPRANLGAAVSNGKIYAIGGQFGPEGGYQYLATVEVYDPLTDTWTSGPPMPTARGYVGVVTGNNGNIYAIGGWNDVAHLKTVERYDVSTNTWSTDSDMPTGRNALGVVATNNGKIYAIGGEGDNRQVLTTVEQATIAVTSNPISSKAFLPIMGISAYFQSLKNPNYAGYAVKDGPTSQAVYKDVTATWKVPGIVSCEAGEVTREATWAGFLDSVGHDVSDLVQIGTNGVCNPIPPLGSEKIQSAFWQVYKGGKTEGPQLILPFLIAPGNQIKVEVKSYCCGEFGIDIWNLSLGSLHWSKVVSGDNASKATAVATCIQEDPENARLAHFSSVAITCTVDKHPIGSAGTTVYQFVMEQAKTGPLNNSGLGDTFTVDWIHP